MSAVACGSSDTDSQTLDSPSLMEETGSAQQEAKACTDGPGASQAQGVLANTSAVPAGQDPEGCSEDPTQRTIDEQALAIAKAEAEEGPVAAAPDVVLDQDPSAPGGGPEPQISTVVSSFEAHPYTGLIPPDSTIAAGPVDLLTAVNSNFRIFNKSGGLLANFNLINWFANVLPANTSGILVFDPWVLYDNLNGRFIMVAVARRTTDGLSRFLVSVSDNNGAAGNWCNWSLNARVNGSTDTNNWADYPKAGINGNAVILTANMFSFSGNAFQYAKVRVLPKSTLYNTSCPAVSWHDFWSLTNQNGTLAETVQPANTYVVGNTGALVNSRFNTGSFLTLWSLNTPYPSPPTLTRRNLGVPGYSAPPGAQQRGTTALIPTGDARLLNVTYRATGLWADHTIACSWPGETVSRSCLRWYQINFAGGSLIQSGTFGAPGSYYYYPAITATANQQATLVFNRSSTSEFAGIRFTGRNTGDATGTLQGSGLLRGGQGCYTQGRWGDYNGISLDPSTQRSWIMSEFVFGSNAACTGNVWRTQVGQLTVP